MNEQETWRAISGFEDYMVSDQGRVYSYKRNKIMSGSKDNDGYLHVSLRKNGKQKSPTIHSLVAKHFIPNPKGYPEVHHKNADKRDNRAENLEWVNHQYNTEFSMSKAYVFYDPDDNKIEIYNINRFAREKGLEVGRLIPVAQGKLNSYHGYTSKPGIKLNRTGKFCLISPEGKIFTFERQIEAAYCIGAVQNSISQLLNGKRKSVRGWTLPDEH